MLKVSCLKVGILLVGMFMVTVLFATPVLRIMPLGDSITNGDGSTDTAGYRGPLWTLLKDAGYNAVRYQWRKNGVAIPGATESGLLIAGQEDSIGTYDVIAFDANGACTYSDAADVSLRGIGAVIILR